MSNQCPYCGSFRNVCVSPESFRYVCLACEKFFCKCEQTKQTVFHRITASPEVLAEKLVYRYDGNGTWRSFLLYGYEFLTKEEAIAATVEKLKEVVNG